MSQAVFAALGDPVRNAIIDRLTEDDATVGQLASMFTITFQAVSQHVRTLERAGLVTRHREGRHQRVSLEPAALIEATEWLERRRLRLEQRYQRLDDLLAGLLSDHTTRATTPEHDRGPAPVDPSPEKGTDQ
ncbi:MAG TPA: metalloregulator ArsR/SmtB family transcription factor [Propionibacteriaceae bacterium]|nr:metalloregulator ArsR/SmtB family transcription factor [Propionibacteriaceae bacterium]